MKGGTPKDPRNPGLHPDPATYDPSTAPLIDGEFVKGIVVNLMKGLPVDSDDVDDTVQTMRKEWAAQAKANPEFLWNKGKVVAYLKTAVRRDFVDEVNKRRRHLKAQSKLTMETESRLATDDPLTRLEREEKRAAVNRALERLPKQRRRVCTLHFLGEKEMMEIVELLGIAYKTVDAHIQLGSKDLRRMLPEYDPRKPRKE